MTPREVNNLVQAWNHEEQWDEGCDAAVINFLEWAYGKGYLLTHWVYVKGIMSAPTKKTDYFL